MNNSWFYVSKCLILAICFSAIDVKSQPNQFFRVKPSNADVAEGGTAIIACEVANRRGRVQWTKDGLTLGKFNQWNWNNRKIYSRFIFEYDHYFEATHRALKSFQQLIDPFNCFDWCWKKW